MRSLFAALALALLPVAAAAQYQYGEFRQLPDWEAKGRPAEIFRALLCHEGGEAEAVYTARERPEEYLRILAGLDGVPAPRRLLVEGELHLLLGRRDRALACYRAVQARQGTRPGDGWSGDLVPPDTYFADAFGGSITLGLGRRTYTLHSPNLWIGGGGMLDNWLLRRFLALGAWDEAAREFARIAALHRAQARPFVARVDAGGRPAATWRIVRPPPVSCAEMRFALDHAAFWKSRRQPQRALAVLREMLERLDLAWPDDRFDIGAVVPADRLPYPARTWMRPERYHDAAMALIGDDATGFLRLAWQAFVAAGQGDELLRWLDGRAASGDQRAK